MANMIGFRKALPPMEAASAAELPRGDHWQYEPKWDGFRCIAFRNGPDVELQSKAGKSLTRYFPEVVRNLLAPPAKRFVLDGELVIPIGKQLSFDALLQRIHPAASRIGRLSAETPAVYIVFDLLLDERGRNLLERPLRERRKALERFTQKQLAGAGVKLSPASHELRTALTWRRKAGNALDGLIAKNVTLPYRSGERDGMVKVKEKKTADCVVGGFRYASKGGAIGSLLLGLYDREGLLHHVGFVAGNAALKDPELTGKLKRLKGPSAFTGSAPGGSSRWSTERSAQWEPVKPKLVVEVEFDHLTGGRFRHGTRFLRWRPDKEPRQCTIRQVGQEKASPLALIPKTDRRLR